ncbi:pirin family protein [Gordonia hongkongensis]|uniref:Pirin family protein n=1 Tax=Gordonia hongkongensis TaxID=1701090 RepID=A0ABT6BTT7_9ACTN|nr:pirin-like bicupin family protein [Gordonia hongkongensis]MDF6101429.1 pirin family protein [Gordonia hongkongensis]OCW86340.1 quercetin 2,3-dioxygenase [Nocardia farcinica]
MVFTVFRGDDRPVTATDWLTSRHCFSFGDHYDPSNTHFGALLAVNDEVVAPGAGFGLHTHQESEIVTWVVAGTLVHRDSAGHSGVLYPGLVQRMSAGTGVEHSERNDSWPDLPDAGTEPVRYVQMWLMPDRHGLAPSYAQADVRDRLAAGGLVPIASGVADVDAAVSVANSGATLFAARLRPGETVEVPASRFTHLFVVDGQVEVDGVRDGEIGILGPGDALRGIDSASFQIRAGDDSDAEVLVWSMAAGLGGA